MQKAVQTAMSCILEIYALHGEQRWLGFTWGLTVDHMCTHHSKQSVCAIKWCAWCFITQTHTFANAGPINKWCGQLELAVYNTNTTQVWLCGAGFLKPAKPLQLQQGGRGGREWCPRGEHYGGVLEPQGMAKSKLREAGTSSLALPFPPFPSGGWDPGQPPTQNS